MRKINDTKLVQMIQEGKQQKEIAEYFGVSPAAICKRLKRLTPLPPSLEALTEKEQRFVIAKAKGATATQAAMKSYECSSLQSAKAIGSQLMGKPEIREAIDSLMENEGLTRAYRVKKLKQHVDHNDPGVSLKALDMSFKLDGSFIERRMNLNVNTHSFIDVPVNIDEYRGWDKKSVAWIQKIKQWMDEGLDLSDVEIADRLLSNADCVRDLKRELARRLKEGIPLDATGWGYELKATNNY